MTEVSTIHDGETRWTVQSRLAKPFEALLKEIGGREKIPVIKENLVRTVYRVPFPTDEGKEIILKDHRLHTWDQHLRYMILPSKARAEWRAMRRLQAIGFPTAIPVAFGEARQGGVLRGCHFASIAIPDAVPFPELYEKEAGGNTKRKEDLLRSLAELLARLHDRGVYHRDMHVGNVLVANETLHLIDLHRARFRHAVSRFMRLTDLGKLCHSMAFFAGEEDLRFLMGAYGEVSHPEMNAIIENVAKLERERIHSRSLRCVKNSTAFRKTRVPEGIFYHRRVWPEDLLRSALERLDDDVIHESPRARVSHVDTRQGGLAIKEYRYPRWAHLVENLFRSSPARKAYIAGRGLEEIKVPTPCVIGLLERRLLGVTTRSFLFTRHIPSDGLEARLRKIEEPGKRREFIRSFGRAIRRIHDQGVYQPDMAGQNFIVPDGEGEPLFHLVDLDRVRLCRTIDREPILRNLCQLGHMPGTLSRTDRIRFLKAYTGGTGWLLEKETMGALGRAIDKKAADQQVRIARLLEKQSRG